MVAKITYGATIYGAVSYNQQKVDEGTAHIIHSHKMIMNLDGKEPITFPQTLRSFEDYLTANKRTKTPVAHFSLNPAPGDKLTDDMYSRLADDYMKEMGYKDQPYIVYRHNDIDREHIHIVSVRIEETGKKISDKYDYKRSMAACRQLELNYGLQQIGDKKQEESVSYLNRIDHRRGDIKRQLSNTVKTLIHDYAFQSFGEYNALLSCFNIHCKQVKGEEDGNRYNGIIYTPTDDKGMPVGTPIKSSRIGKAVGYNALNKLIVRNQEKIKREGLMVSNSKNIIKRLMQVSPDKQSFIRDLKRSNIDVLFRENEQGRIYGVTFIDYNYKAVYNGSRLGKEFSANVFQKLLNESDAIQSKDDLSQHDSFNKNSYEQTITPYLVDDIFGEFYIQHPSQDAEEEALRRKMQRKRKNKRRRL